MRITNASGAMSSHEAKKIVAAKPQLEHMGTRLEVLGRRLKDRAADARDTEERKAWARPWDDPDYVEEHVETQPVESDAGRADEWLERLDLVQNAVRAWWPVHWPYFETGLALFISLLLERVSQGVGIILLGESGVGKNVVIESFMNVPLAVWRDKFTPKSILSGYAAVGTTKVDVNNRALFRKVKHKALIVSDCGPIFSGNREGQAEMYALIPPWLDGRGLVFDVGTHGTIGEKGDFSFVMFGGKTPIYTPTWLAMNHAGPRFLFLRVPRLKHDERVPPRDYEQAKREVEEAVRSFLTWVFETHAVRSMQWPELSKDHEACLEDYAQVMAEALTLRSGWGGDIVRPTSNHLLQRLAIVTCARAVLWQRQRVDVHDLVFAKRFVRGTGPGQRGRVLLALYEGADEVKTICDATGLSYNAVASALADLQKVDVVQQRGARRRDGKGAPAELWVRSPEEVDVERLARDREECS
jgi:hypothetical protein